MNREEYEEQGREFVRKYKRVKLLILGEWLLYPLMEREAMEPLKLVEARNYVSSTIVCSQFGTSGWREHLYVATLADAICDRIIHNSYNVPLKGESMRKLNSVTI